MERVTGTPPLGGTETEFATWADGHQTTQEWSTGAASQSWWIVRGVDTPNFQRSRERLPLNSYFWHRFDTECSCSWNYSTDAYTAHSSSNHMAAPPPDGRGFEASEGEIAFWLEESGCNLDALTTGAAAALATKYFDLGTALGELRETVRMFKDFLSQFVKIITTMKAEHLIELMNSPNALASRWLWYRYGLMPLVYSIRDWIKANNAKDTKLKWYSERKAGSWQYNKEEEFDWDHGNFSLGCTYDIDVKIAAYGYAGSQIRPQLFRIAPLTTGWELLRFSFIVDWFVEVGSFLTSLEAAGEFPDLALSRNYKILYTKSFIGKGMKDNGSESGYHGNYDTKTVTSGEIRARLPGGSLGELQFNGFGLSDIHLADLLALLVSALSKKSS